MRRRTAFRTLRRMKSALPKPLPEQAPTIPTVQSADIGSRAVRSKMRRAASMATTSRGGGVSDDTDAAVKALARLLGRLAARELDTSIQLSSEILSDAE